MTGYPLLRAHRPDAAMAWRAGRPISAATFLHDVAALAERLPSHRHMVNLCTDRYCFTVGFAAALCRNQTNLLPPHGAPELLRQLTQDYPDVYCLTDDASPADLSSLPGFRYPSTLSYGRSASEIPVVAAEQPACVLFTSGSTGRPTPHARSWGELVTSALAEGGRLGIASLHHASLLGTVPHQHSYGLESLVMLALQHGLALHAERLFYPADIRAGIAAAARPRVLVTTPVHLRVLLAEEATPPPVDLVLCATAPLATHLAREAEARFAVALYEIYGCSEAGQIAARRTAVTEEWRCLDGIALRHDAAGTWASGVPIATETLLPDVIELRDPTRFLLHGRIADLVDVAGKRTSLAHLNYHLNAIDGVRDGAFAISDAAEPGAVSRLVAFVVGPGLTAEFILGELRRRIDVAFLPRPVCLVPELPRNALGKLPHQEIQRLIAEARQGAQAASMSTRRAAPAMFTARADGGADAGGPGGTATRHFAVGHPAAEGHFPGNPIIPGAVLLREVVAAICAAGDAPDEPARCEIPWAKFHQPVRPGDTLVISWAASGAEIRFSGTIAGAAQPAVTGAVRLPLP
jgi:acyl-CoA synthetase (AMP-forming)/AMP-acid ligase II